MTAEPIVIVGFPLSIALVARPNMRDKMRSASDVQSCLKAESKIFRLHPSLDAYYEHGRERRRERIAAGEWDAEACVAKIANGRSLKAGAIGRITGDDVRRVFSTYGRACLCCGSGQRITIDHVVPLSKGGENSFGNLQPLCRSCNSRKCNKTADYRTGGESKRREGRTS